MSLHGSPRSRAGSTANEVGAVSSSRSRLGLASGWEKINAIRFNPDGSYFAVAMQDGFRLCRTDPLEEISHRDIKMGSVSLCEPHYQYTTLMFVSGGKEPRHSEKCAILWDDASKTIELFYTVQTKVLNVLMRQDMICIVQKNRIQIFPWPINGYGEQKSKVIYEMETADNPKGLCEIAPEKGPADQDPFLPMFAPDRNSGPGCVAVINLANVNKDVTTPPRVIKAHKNPLSCIAVNQTGTMLATSSEKGTLIRIWDAKTQAQVGELRRGTDTAKIYCINFSLKDEYLCCSSDKGTVHIFALAQYNLNRRSALASIGVPGSYLASHWSLANFSVPQEVACVCAFGKNPGEVFAVCIDGSFHKYHFKPNECTQISYDDFTQICKDCHMIRMIMRADQNKSEEEARKIVTTMKAPRRNGGLFWGRSNTAKRY